MTNAKSDLWENDLLLLVFQNTVAGAAIAGLGSGVAIAASSVPESIWLELHEVAVADSDVLQTVKTPMSYTGYLGPIAVARSSGGWTVAAQNASNAALIQFGNNTGALATSVDVTLGNNGTPASSEILYYGPAALAVSTGVNPQYAIGALDIDET